LVCERVFHGAEGWENVKEDIYQKITNQIVEALGKGIRPWVRPSSSEHAAGPITRPLRHNLEPFNGINVILLWGEAMEKGYENPVWMSFKQAKDLGGSVRKGGHGTMVVFADKLTKKDETTDEEKVIPILKSCTSFNVEQIDGLPERFYTRAAPVQNAVERDATAEAFLKPKRGHSAWRQQGFLCPVPRLYSNAPN
jgi:antirestriction protein ArdC